MHYCSSPRIALELQHIAKTEKLDNLRESYDERSADAKSSDCGPCVIDSQNSLTGEITLQQELNIANRGSEASSNISS